jgi:DNA-directed RNA polymerase subunit RPC12/RpoP
MTENRIQFTCIDCGKDVDREPHKMDVEGLTPKRCAQCVFDRMAEP